MEKNIALEKATSLIDNTLLEPDLFLSVQSKLATKLKKLIKLLYDDSNYEKSSSKALKELFIKNCDEEQIWQQIELQNELSLINLTQVLNFKNEKSGELDFALPLSLDKPKKIKKKVEEKVTEKEEEDENEENFEDFEEDEENVKTPEKSPKKSKSEMKKRKKSSIVDDKFFKLDEMNDFLINEEKRPKKNKKSVNLEEEEIDSDEESVDLFEDYEDDEGDEENEDEDENGRDLMYADFFDSPEEGEEREGKRKFAGEEREGLVDEEERANEGEERPMLEMLHNSRKKRVKFSLGDDSDETDSLENREKEENVEKEDAEKTNFEKREERLRKKIEILEEENLREKSWQMKGEVSAKDRPEYSLLEEYLETDITARPAPIITEATTEKLEDIIKRRIKDKSWDDVEKKFKPVETPMEYKKKLVLDQEKSKLSLAQIYENEYLRQKKSLEGGDEADEGEVEEEPKEHVEIRRRMVDLFRKLDALANYHYTPKMAKPEVKIVSNVPAISMEEVAPTATSDATLLAPEEIKTKPRGDLKGKSERTKTDIKRAHRRKKLHQKKVQKAKELRAKETPLVKKKFSKKGKQSKDGKMKTKTDGLNVKNITSTAVFSQLQDEVRSAIKAKTLAKTTKKTKNTFVATKLKL